MNFRAYYTIAADSVLHQIYLPQCPFLVVMTIPLPAKGWGDKKVTKLVLTLREKSEQMEKIIMLIHCSAVPKAQNISVCPR